MAVAGGTQALIATFALSVTTCIRLFSLADHLLAALWLWHRPASLSCLRMAAVIYNAMFSSPTG